MKKSIVYYTLALALMPLTVFGFSLDEPENMNEQTGYYYQGKKIPLTLNEYKNCICIPKDSVGIKDRILANISILDIINDNAFFLYIVHVSDYQKLTSMDFWEKDSKSIITTQCYFFDRGIEVFTDPYIIVGLKKEEDRSILESYSEQYGFKIIGNGPQMPLYYILAITPECKMNTLECANKLYETGQFASSEPDLCTYIRKTNSQTAYYYYQGEKINLTLNENKTCLFVPKDSVGISQRVLATLEPLDVINDDEYVIYVINDEDYQELSITDPWDDDSRSVITTQCYFTEKGTEVYSSPYIILGLKKEQDSSILESYSEQYGFKIVRNEPLMPLYYILSITPKCKMNTLGCANKLYETGLFASSEPDLMSVINKSNGGTPTLVDETAIQPVQVLETKYYNITGQTTDSPSGLILVVTRYSDGTVSTEKKLFY